MRPGSHRGPDLGDTKQKIIPGSRWWWWGEAAASFGTAGTMLGSWKWRELSEEKIPTEWENDRDAKEEDCTEIKLCPLDNFPHPQSSHKPATDMSRNTEAKLTL